jgi:tetratricopeptide (TPR) repeat protein
MSAAFSSLVARAQVAQGRRRADLLYQAGLEAGRGGDLGRASGCLGEALALEPRHEAARDALLRLWDEPGLDPNQLGALPEVGDELLRAELLCLRAAAWVGRGEAALGRQDAQDALALDPASRRARHLLGEAQARLGDWAGVARSLVEEAEVSLDEQAQAACLRQAGLICAERLGQEREGSQLLRRATGKGGQADFGLRRLLRAEGDEEALMAYARDEARRLPEGAARSGLALEAAALAALRLDDPVEARRVLSQATPLVGGQEPDPDVLLALEFAVAWGQSARPHPDDLGALRALGRVLVSPSRRASVFSKIGRRTLEEEGVEEIEAEKGLRYLEAALDADPRYLEALEALEAAHEDGHLSLTRGGGARMRRGEEAGRPDWLLKAATRLEAQGAYDEAAGLLAKAVVQCDEVELGSPGSPLERLMALSPPWELLRGAVMEAAQRARALVVRRELWELLAREAWARGDEPTAGHALVRLVELDPDERFYVELLAALYGRVGAWGALEEVRRREAAHSAGTDPERAREAWVSAGRLRLVQGDSAGALACFQEVLAQAPDDLAAIVGAGRILVREERWVELAQVFEAELACAHDEAAIASMAFRCATLYERQIGDLERAWAGYERVRQLNAHHLPSLLGMIRLSARRHDWPAWARLVQEWAERERDDVLSGALLCELGHVQESSLHDLEAATVSYRRSLERAPGLDLARLGLIRCLFRRGLRQEAVSVMRAVLPDMADPADRLDLLSSSALLGDDERQGAADLLAEFPEHASALLATFRTSLQDGATPQAARAARALSEVLAPSPLQAAFGRLASLLGRLAGAGQEDHWIYEEARLLAKADHANLAEHLARFARRLDLPHSRSAPTPPNAPSAPGSSTTWPS